MSQPKYWRGIEELEQHESFIKAAEAEFPTDISIQEALEQADDQSLGFQANRRDFLKVLGFGVSAAVLAACAEGPVKKAIPYVNKPDDIIPGVPNFYASTTPSGSPALVKTREGRPIKLEGNPDSPLTKGGLSAGDQATVLDLYDDARLRGPVKGQNLSTWETVDGEIRSKLTQIQNSGGSVRVVSHTVMSPSTQAIIDAFVGQFEGGKHVQYDPVSASALLDAHEAAFGSRAIPQYHFDKAKAIVSFNADFLGTWLSPVEFAANYVVNRHPDKPMSRHLQFEGIMSITGAKADLRFPLTPSKEGVALLNLHNKVATKLGKQGVPSVPEFNVAMNGIDKAADDLVKFAGESLLVCGTNSIAAQSIVVAINDMLGNYGTTLDIANPAHYKKGSDQDLIALVDDLGRGNVAGVIFYGANPVYDSSAGQAIKDALSGVTLSVSTASKTDETSSLCQYTAPDHHFLESWGDVQQTANHVSLIQPTIHPIFKSRQAQDSFLTWMGNEEGYHGYLKTYWETNMFPQSGQEAFRPFWNEALRAGLMTLPAVESLPAMSMTADDLREQGSRLKEGFNANMAEDAFDVVFYERVATRDGKQANNPWLQELPDPITRIAWDNYVSVPVSYAKAKGLNNEDVVEIKAGGNTMYMPVLVQPGQAPNTLGIAVGYGSAAGKTARRANGEKQGDRQIAGTNVYPAVIAVNGAMRYMLSGASISKTGGTYPLALSQTFDTLYDPAKGAGMFKQDFDRTERIIEETTTANYTNGKYKARVEKREEFKKHLVTLWDSHFEDPETNRNIHWKMAIDLNKCTGCGACVVACHAENNVPVVGKEEVRKRRAMHWLRIDRYYSGDMDNPDAVFQPMMCQHCDNAPCETVCPVLATIHSNEGLNQMAYNRCVGTRYCANNCPYKVRRFNWFNYWNDKPKFNDFYTHSELGRLVLNPDVTVRFRGVMEKCSFCVQRLQDAKLKAKIAASSSFAKPEDGAAQTACQQSCPTGAIVFGDFNDPKSEVSKLYREARSYAALEDIKTLPSVQYMAQVRNRDEAETLYKEEALAEARNYS